MKYRVARSIEGLPPDLRADVERKLAAMEKKYGDEAMSIAASMDLIRQILASLPEGVRDAGGSAMVVLCKAALKPLGFTGDRAAEMIVEMGNLTDSLRELIAQHHAAGEDDPSGINRKIADILAKDALAKAARGDGPRG